jgi:imidazolonepropionase-like amidohydrolase
MNAGARLKAKIHVNQFNSIGGIQAGVKHKALSVDHLEIMTPEDIEALKNMETMPRLTFLLLFLKYSIYPSPQNDCSWTSTSLSY